jgi:hypothetical protein
MTERSDIGFLLRTFDFASWFNFLLCSELFSFVRILATDDREKKGEVGSAESPNCFDNFLIPDASNFPLLPLLPHLIIVSLLNCQ